MNRKSLFTTLALLSATALGGCASQNAMDNLPNDVRLAVTADAVRQQQPDATPAAKDDAAPRQTAALSEIEQEYRRRQANALPPEAGSQMPPEKEDAQTLFNRAREMQALRELPAEPQQQEATSVEAQMDTAEAQATWQAALAMHRSKAVSPQAGLDTAITGQAGPAQPVAEAEPAPDSSIVTAAVATPMPLSDLHEFVMAGDGKSIADEDAMALRLKALGGRVARRIVVGRIAGSGFEVLASAQDVARSVSKVTGGNPGMSYEPSMSEGAVRVEYEPFAGKVK